MELWGKWEDEVKRWGVVGPGAVSRPAVGGGARDPTLHCVTVRSSSSSRVGQFCGRDISDISDVCHLKVICAKTLTIKVKTSSAN